MLKVFYKIKVRRERSKTKKWDVIYAHLLNAADITELHVYIVTHVTLHFLLYDW